MKKVSIIILLLTITFTLFAQDKTDDTTEPKQKNGWDHYADGNYEESIKALEEERKVYTDRINIYVILGWDYKMLKNYVEMEKISLEGIAIQPSDIRVIRNLAEAYYFQRKWSDAIPLFEKYISYRYNWDDPFIQTVYYYLGICFIYEEKYRKADIALSTAKNVRPNDVNTLIRLAFVKEKLEEYKKAISLYNTALKIQPTNQSAAEGLKRSKNNQ